ncbi:MAG: hypothetical protein WC330_07820, partial [Candidatus Omnitrophota bacterium]
EPIRLSITGKYERDIYYEIIGIDGRSQASQLMEKVLKPNSTVGMKDGKPVILAETTDVVIPVEADGALRPTTAKVKIDGVEQTIDLAAVASSPISSPVTHKHMPINIDRALPVMPMQIPQNLPLKSGSPVFPAQGRGLMFGALRKMLNPVSAAYAETVDNGLSSIQRQVISSAAKTDSLHNLTTSAGIASSGVNLAGSVISPFGVGRAAGDEHQASDNGNETSDDNRGERFDARSITRAQLRRARAKATLKSAKAASRGNGRSPAATGNGNGFNSGNGVSRANGGFRRIESPKIALRLINVLTGLSRKPHSISHDRASGIAPPAAINKIQNSSEVPAVKAALIVLPSLSSTLPIYNRNIVAAAEAPVASTTTSTKGASSATVNKELVLLIATAKEKEVNYSNSFTAEKWLRLYWKTKGFSLKIIKNATSEDLKDALQDASVRYVGIMGHGFWSRWQATDRLVVNEEVTEWMAGREKKEMFISYSCARLDGETVESRFGYAAVKNPAANLRGVKGLNNFGVFLFKPSLFSLSDWSKKRTVLLFNALRLTVLPAIASVSLAAVFFTTHLLVTGNVREASLGSLVIGGVTQFFVSAALLFTLFAMGDIESFFVLRDRNNKESVRKVRGSQKRDWRTGKVVDNKTSVAISDVDAADKGGSSWSKEQISSSIISLSTRQGLFSPLQETPATRFTTSSSTVVQEMFLNRLTRISNLLTENGRNTLGQKLSNIEASFQPIESRISSSVEERVSGVTVSISEETEKRVRGRAVLSTVAPLNYNPAHELGRKLHSLSRRFLSVAGLTLGMVAATTVPANNILADGRISSSEFTSSHAVDLDGTVSAPKHSQDSVGSDAPTSAKQVGIKETKADAAALISQLDDDSFGKRQAATRKLIEIAQNDAHLIIKLRDL